MKFIICVLAFLVVAQADARVFLESDKTHHLPLGWKEVGPAEDTDRVTLTFVLHVRQAQLLDKMAWAVSDPSSPSYANYLSFEEMIDAFAPEMQNVQTLKNWLHKYHVEEKDITVTPTRDFITATVPVAVANHMFGVTLREYEHEEFGRIVKTIEPYSVPRSIEKVVSFVSGLVRFPSKNQIKSVVKAASEKRQNSGVTPSFIWNAFNTDGARGTNRNNSQAVAQFLGQFYNPLDLSTFQSQYSLPATKPTVVGPNSPSNPGVEASLDIEYITGTAPGVPTWFWSTSGEHEGQERFVVWATGLNSRATIPWVHSVSYGDVESSVSFTYASRLDQELKKLAVRGVTVLFASGDDGVGCSSCVNVPNWPASSIWVTAVGGFDQNFVGDSISSGGFSNYFAQPIWQKAAVTNYLRTNRNLPSPNQFNISGRAMPDVAAFSENVQVISGGYWEPVGGTSCAAPTFAGIVTLINDALLNAGKKPVGAMNAALYKIGSSTPKAFVDITSGNNANGCCTGFSSQAGWDPQTGWGGPNFPVLKQAFMALQK